MNRQQQGKRQDRNRRNSPPSKKPGSTGRETGTQGTTVEASASKRASQRPLAGRRSEDVAVKPELPGNIPAGTSDNPVMWGEPYDSKRKSGAGRRRADKKP